MHFARSHNFSPAQEARMIRPRFAILPLLVLLMLTSAGKAVDKEKLRRAVRLPVVSASEGFYVGSAGFSLHHWREIPLSQQITALRKSLKGDASDAESYCRLGVLYAKAEQPVHSKKSYSTAAELCRQQLRLHLALLEVALREKKQGNSLGVIRGEKVVKEIIGIE
jgi:cytochrome c-type biogenesis protein CcmH/NrfG